MTEVILIFTFSPVQGFIAEARRASDLYAGSHILVKLATAAANAIGINHLVYPTDLTQDAPNKLVAKVSYDEAAKLAQNAENRLVAQWQEFVAESYRTLVSLQPKPDSTWQEIWKRQINNYWECYWAFAPYDGQNYWQAYQTASQALDAAKRTRRFVQVGEPGLKDTLSGQRSALRLQQLDARDYWNQVSTLNNLTAAKLRPNGRERLDAVGVVKRFGLPHKDYQTFLSVGSVATADFLVQAKKYPDKLQDYREAVEELLADKLYRVRQDKDWPYDGDLFFLETLTANRLEDSYNLKNPDPVKLNKAIEALKELYQNNKNESENEKEKDKVVVRPPNPYYAILLLDGDGMGEKANHAAQVGEKSHKEFSQKLSQFASGVEGIVIRRCGQPIYSGGDDVLALAPVSTSLKIGQALQARFSNNVGGTASAGIAIAHHLYPLDAAIQAARAAEQVAKRVEGKGAVAVRALKRSGQMLEVRSKWEDIPPSWATLIDYFQAENSPLSSRFVYSVAGEARIVTSLDKNARCATLQRLIGRHKKKELGEDEARKIRNQLVDWAAKMDGYISKQKIDGREIPQGFAELGRWLLLARFMAQRGGD